MKPRYDPDRFPSQAAFDTYLHCYGKIRVGNRVRLYVSYRGYDGAVTFSDRKTNIVAGWLDVVAKNTDELHCGMCPFLVGRKGTWNGMYSSGMWGWYRGAEGTSRYKSPDISTYSAYWWCYGSDMCVAQIARGKFNGND
jgi:hypothetical protein